MEESNIAGIIRDYDFIIDGTDNFPAKFLINDACVRENKPFSHGGVMSFEGQTLTYVPGAACYRCVFSAPPPIGVAPNCAQMGVLGSVVGILGTIQATEALKYLLATGDLLVNRLLVFDARQMRFRTVECRRDPHCSGCSQHTSAASMSANSV